jgi:protein gp37
MTAYSSMDAAAELGTTPRLLRRFIRQNDSWKNATHAGRYSFTESEMKSLKVQFDKWQGTRSSRRPTSKVEAEELFHLDEDKGIRPEQMSLMKTNPQFRNQVLANRAERYRKLNKRIAEVGIHNKPTYELEDSNA